MQSSTVRSVHRQPVAVLWTWPFSSELLAVRGSATALSECRNPALTTVGAEAPSTGAGKGRSLANTVRAHRRAEAAPAPVDRGWECGDQRAGFALGLRRGVIPARGASGDDRSLTRGAPPKCWFSVRIPIGISAEGLGRPNDLQLLGSNGFLP